MKTRLALLGLILSLSPLFALTARAADDKAVAEKEAETTNTASASIEDAAAAIEDAKSPRELVEIAIEKVLAVIQDPALAGGEHKAERREKMRQLFLKAFDMNTVAILSLSSYREKFSKEELADFTDVFSRLLFTTYIGHIEKYAGEKIDVKEPKELAPGKVVVETLVKADTGEIAIDYSVQKMKDAWKAYDVRVEGVSLVRNYRTQFRESLVKKSPADLIKQLREKVAENEKNS